jgi:hypothetical protein
MNKIILALCVLTLTSCSGISDDFTTIGFEDQMDLLYRASHELCHATNEKSQNKMLSPGNILYNKIYHYSALVLQTEIDKQSKIRVCIVVDNTSFRIITWSFDLNTIEDSYIVI